jgi:hypothetical protein
MNVTHLCWKLYSHHGRALRLAVFCAPGLSGPLAELTGGHLMSGSAVYIDRPDAILQFLEDVERDPEFVEAIRAYVAASGGGGRGRRTTAESKAVQRAAARHVLELLGSE